MPRLETKYDLLPRFQINIASINLVSKSIYLLASSKFGQSLLVMRNYLEDLSQSVNYFELIIIYISIYTLSDIGDLRNKYRWEIEQLGSSFVLFSFVFSESSHAEVTDSQ